MLRRALHCWPFILLSIAALLYGAGCAGASEAIPAGTPSRPAPLEDHVALLLPVGSDAYAHPAAAVQAGFVEAAKKQSGAPLAVRLYPVSEDPQDVVAAYERAVAAGARAIVGPLTRNGVTALATSNAAITVPTLALNVPDRAGVYPPNLYTLSLHIEAEARQVANLALREGRSKALTITEPTPLGRRMRDAFVAAFERAGAFHIADYDYTTESEALEALRHAASLGVADMVFLALDAQRASLVRPYVAALPAYGTSQINPGAVGPAGFIDLPDVRFIDMPWMLQPDHPAVMLYSRQTPYGSPDLERLRALGIDAFRVARALAAGELGFDIDGVTGHLTLGADGQVRRGLLVTLVTGGQLTILGEIKP